MANRPLPSGDNPFLSGPILPPLIRFALPLMLSLLLQAFYGGVDLAVVGKFSPTASVSAVATGSQVMQSITSIITGLTMGVTVLVGKAMGSRESQQAGQVVCSQIRLFTLVAAVLTGAMLLLAPQAARLMNVPEAAMSEAVAYIRICSAGIVFITAYNGISGIFRGVGNSRSPFLFVLIACLVNVVLDVLFVGVFRLHAAGAALATIIAQATSVAFSLSYIRRNPLPFSIPAPWRRGGRAAGEILKVGSPIALQDFLTNLSFLIITSIVNALGVIASAGVGIAEKLFIFLALVPMSFMSALSTFVAQNMGAGNPKRANRALFLAARISLCVGAVMCRWCSAFWATLTDGNAPALSWPRAWPPPFWCAFPCPTSSAACRIPPCSSSAWPSPPRPWSTSPCAWGTFWCSGAGMQHH